jgi:hypothetical protein
MAKKKKRVAIIGKGPGRGLAPNQTGQGIHLWGINNVWIGQPLDIIVDIHDLDWNLQECIANYSHLRQDHTDEQIREKAEGRLVAFKLTKEYAIKHNIPIMSQKTYVHRGEKVPGFAYPLDKITQKFDCDLLTSATPYAIAYAIFRKYTHIDLYGINCLHNEEWGLHRDAVVGWLMYAKGAGIKVTVSGQAARPLRAWDGRLYGYNIPQKLKGVKDQDGNVDLNTGEEKYFDVWREY